MSSHCSWAIQALLAIVLLGKGIWGQEVKAQILTWANWELHPDFSNSQQDSGEGKSPWAYGGTILKNYVKDSISSKWSYFSSLRSLQVPCAVSGSWSQGLLMCSPSGIQRGRSCTPFHTHHFIRGQDNSGLSGTYVKRRELQLHHLIWKINTETLSFIFCVITFALQNKSRPKDGKHASSWFSCSFLALRTINFI